jgi:hypothetical protein
MNCSFYDIKGTSPLATCISCLSKTASYNITNCSFSNISNNNSAASAGCVEYIMDVLRNGDYLFFGNIFENITSFSSAVKFQLSFISFNFSDNCFKNITSSFMSGGV